MDLPQPLETAPDQPVEIRREGGAEAPLGAVAAALVEAVAKRSGAVVHLAEDERAAEELADLAQAFAPGLEVLVFPPWDCLPYDRASPSATSMGGRMATLLALARSGDGSRLVLTSPEALIQLTLPAAALQGVEHTVALDRAGEVEAITAFAWRTGYRNQEEVAEPGDMSLRGEVLDIFPPAAGQPLRLEISDGQVRAVHAFDPLSQLTTDTLEALTLGPASELIAPEADAESGAFVRSNGLEHDLPRLSGPLVSLLDHAPGASVCLAEDVRARLKRLADQIASAYEAARTLAVDRKRSAPPRPETLYLDAAALMAELAACKARELKVKAHATPLFALAKEPVQDAAHHLSSASDAGGVGVLAGPGGDVNRLSREMERRSGKPFTLVDDWAAVNKAQAGDLLGLPVDLTRGFELEEPRLCVVATQDVLGTRARRSAQAPHPSGLEAEPDLRFGDLVIHEDHGVAVLRALETVEANGAGRPTARLARVPRRRRLARARRGTAQGLALWRRIRRGPARPAEHPRLVQASRRGGSRHSGDRPRAGGLGQDP